MSLTSFFRGNDVCCSEKNMPTRIFTTLYPILCIALLLGSQQSLNAQQPQGGRIITIGEDRPDLNFAGRFFSSTVGSDQFGYLSKIEGISNVFNSTAVKLSLIHI